MYFICNDVEVPTTGPLDEYVVASSDYRVIYLVNSGAIKLKLNSGLHVSSGKHICQLSLQNLINLVKLTVVMCGETHLST